MTTKKKNLVRDDPAEAGRRGGSIGGKRSRGGGRPKKYKTEAERLAAKRASALRSYHNRKRTDDPVET